MSAAPPAIHAMCRACEDAFRLYLRQVLEQNPPERHAGIKEQFAAHMDFLADFCLRDYPGACGLTVEFIKGLHRAMFPPDFKRAVTTREGAIVWLIPGEFKTVSNNVAASYLHPGKTNAFTPAAEVPQAMARLVADINRTLAESEDPSSKADAILAFMDDFFQILPFVDGNGRVCYTLVDLLAIQNDMPALGFAKIVERDCIRLVQALELEGEQRTLTPYYSLLAEHGWPNQRIKASPQVGVSKSLFDIYWRQRYAAFSLWDKGIQWDWTGLRSVKAEVLALHIANQIPGDVVLDAFCGIGGFAIALARAGKKVVAVEIDKDRMEMARANARIYDVEDKITFVHGDANEQIEYANYDAALLDPPWGDAARRDLFDWDDFPQNPIPLVRDALKRCNVVVLAVPRGFRIESARIDDFQCDIHEAVLNGQLWWLNLVYRRSREDVIGNVTRFPETQIRAAIEDAFLPYLRQALEQNLPERHAQIEGQFAAHMDFLADFCLRGYPGAGGLTVEFVKGLHRAMFPPDYRQEVTTRDGRKIWMVPGKYKSISNNVGDSYLRPGEVNVFLAPEKVPAAMIRIVGELNAALQAGGDARRRQDAILHFVVDFLGIHPFVDANGRVACILADLLAIRAELLPFYFHAIKVRDLPGLYRAVERARENRDLAPVHEILQARGRAGETHGAA